MKKSIAAPLPTYRKPRQIPGNWANNNRNRFKRDVLHTFCISAYTLEEQFARFEQSGTISFSILSDLLGNESNRGMLWRLKDTAHHLFSSEDADMSFGKYLDWTIGFLFHECIKMLESTYQILHYEPQLVSLSMQEQLACKQKKILQTVLKENLQELPKQIKKIRQLIKIAIELFCKYLCNDAKNRYLARLLHDQSSLVHDVFKNDYSKLLKNIYGEAQERVALEAAISLLEAGRNSAAEQALLEALRINPNSTEALALLNNTR